METRELSQKEKDRLFYVNMLKSDECICGRWKRPKMAFCYQCYKRMPRDIQLALYNRIGAGFEAAYNEAVKWLDD